MSYDCKEKLLIRLNQDASHTAEWPNVGVGEAHAFVLDSKKQALKLVSDIAEQCSAVVISPWHNDLDGLPANAKIVAWKYLKTYHPRAFAIALKRISKNCDTIVYIVDGPTSSRHQITPILDQTLCECAQTLGKSILCIYIDMAETMLEQVIVSPKSGYTSFHTLADDEQNTWRIHFWFNKGHIFRDVVYQNSDVAPPVDKSFEQFRLGKDAPKYIVADAIAQEDSLPTGWRQIESHNNLLDFIEPGLDGTIILTSTQKIAFHSLVGQVHMLRSHAGDIWKIFVRERDRAIRISEEKILLSAGITLVLPRELSLSRVLSLTESFTNWRFDRVLPSLDALFNKLRRKNIQGIVSAQTFFETVPEIAREQHRQGLDFTLIFAHLARGVSVREVLTRAHVSRNNDLISYTRDGVYIFLPACNVADANKVLFGIFRMPVSYLFSYEERATTIRSIELISENALRAELVTPTTKLEFESENFAQDESTDDLHYYPKTQPAKLLSERD